MEMYDGNRLIDELLDRLYNTAGYEDLSDAYERYLVDFRLQFMGEEVDYSHVEYMALTLWSSDLFEDDVNRLNELFDDLNFKVVRMDKPV